MDRVELGSTYLVLLKERAADIAVEGVGKVSSEETKAFLQLIRLLSIVNGAHKQIDKPAHSM